MDSSAAALIAELRQAAQEAPAERLAELPAQAVAWLLLSPGWPESLARAGFPGERGLVRDRDVDAVMQRLVAHELAEIQPRGEPPWSERWFVPNRQNRDAALLELVETRSGLSGLVDMLADAAAAMRQALEKRSPPPQLQRWIELGTQPDVGAMADLLDARVQEAITTAITLAASAAARLGDVPVACPEAVRWIETAEPLARVFAGSLETALARSARRLELFHRQSRDERLLGNYVGRPEQERAIRDLVRPDSPVWALHLIGYGGVGKTMLMRQIKTRLARELNLATARIDFDHINPNFPTRAPGLLLMGFAEELRLGDDSTAFRLFSRFDGAMRSVHDKLESAFREMTIVSLGGAERLDANYGDAEGAFVAALKQIALHATPLLILDTCEELAKARTGSRLPEPLLATFAILERLHAAVPELRVVFSGRRMLAGAGHGWSLPGSPLPERDYLSLLELRGFDERQARTFLEAFRRGGRAVPPALAALILPQSVAEERGVARSVVWRQQDPVVEAGPRYNPYDLDLFAAAACGESPPSPDDLAQGYETLVRERFLNRLSDEVRGIIAELLLVGCFDRTLVEALSQRRGPAADALWDDLRAQEWTDVDRTARENAEVLYTEPHIRRRVCEFLQRNELSTWRAARQRLRPLLRDITLERPWTELVAAYFVAAFDVLSDDLAEAARWWAQIEARIASGGNWGWAQEITALLADEEDGAGTKDGRLIAAVLATRAAAMLRLDPEELDGLWSRVLDAAPRHPLLESSGRLSFYARAGRVAMLRFRPDGIIEATVGDLAEAVAQVPGLPGMDPQSLAAEAAWLEAAADLLEQVAWRKERPLSAIVGLRERAGQLAQRGTPPFDSFGEVLALRFDALLDKPGPLGRAVGARLPALPGDLLHWLAPEDVTSRIRLELLRLNRPFLDPGFDTVPTLSSIDDDRLHALRLQATADHLPVILDLGPAIGQSLILARDRPQCFAHVAVPPFFAVALEISAETGNDASAAELRRIAGDTGLPLDTRQAAQRAVLRLAVYDRSIGDADEGPGVLEQSSKLDDALLFAAYSAFDPKRRRAQYRGRWREAVDWLRGKGVDPGLEPTPTADASFAAFSLSLDGDEAAGLTPEPDMLAEWEKRHPRAWIEAATLRARFGLEPRTGGRLAARLMFDEGSLRALWQPLAAAPSLQAAADLYGTVPDDIGSRRGVTVAALAWARGGDQVRLTDAVRELEGMPADVRVGLRWEERERVARARAEEFDAPGPRTADLRTKPAGGLDEGGLSLELRGVLAGPPPAGARRRPWLTALTYFGIVGFGLAIIFGLLYASALGTQSIAGALGIDVGVWQVLAGLPILAAGLPASVWFYGRSLSFLLFWQIRIEPVEAVANPSRPMVGTQTRINFQLRVRLVDRVLGGSTLLLPATSAEAYADMSRGTRLSSLGWLAPWSRLFGMIGPHSAELATDPRCAAACWEGIFTLVDARPKRPLFRLPVQFRRSGLDTSARARPRLTRGAQIHFLAPSFAATAIRLAWTTFSKPSRGLFATAWQPMGLGPKRADIFHVACEAVEGSGGLELRLRKADAVELEAATGQAREARTAFSPKALALLDGGPPLLVVLQGFDLPEPGRTSADRLAAGLMRRAAAELFEAGVPAVLVLPCLTDALARKAVQPVIEGIAAAPRHGTAALMRAVAKAQRIIAPGGADPDALETALDVCLYCVADLDLSMASDPA